MLTPILRLLAIYLAVALAVFAFFNRDRVAGLLGWGGSEPEPAAIAAVPETAPVPVPEPATDLSAQTPVFAPPPGENGVPDAPEADTAPEATAQPAAAAQPETAAPVLQTPTAPEGASTAGNLQTPVAPVTAPLPEAPQPVAQAPAPSASAAGLQVPTPPAAQTATAAPQTEASATQTDDFDAGLARARAQYWQNDIAGAIATYTDLLAQYPDNETLHGELGNIYYMNGQRVEAAEQFEAAGMAALKAGNRQQAQNLLGVLGSLDRTAAARLQQALEDSQ